jgi:hypothetical protein
MNTMRLSLWVAVSLIALACRPTPPPPGGIYYAKGSGAVTVDGLHRVEWQPFHITYVKPGAELQRYTKMLVQAVTVSYKTPPRDSRLSESNYALPPAAIASLERYFHEAFVEELGKSTQFSIVESAGPNVLLVSGHIIDLEIDVPPRRDQDPDERVYTASSGQMTLVLDGRDSVSGEPLIRVGQRQSIELAGGGWYESNPVENSAAVREIFHRWASNLRREIEGFDELRSLPPVNPPTAPKTSK